MTLRMLTPEMLCDAGLAQIPEVVMSKKMQQCENGWNVDPMRCQRVNESGPSNAAVSNKGDRSLILLLLA